MDLSGFLFGNVDEEGVLEDGSVLDKVKRVLLDVDTPYKAHFNALPRSIVTQCRTRWPSCPVWV